MNTGKGPTVINPANGIVRVENAKDRVPRGLPSTAAPQLLTPLSKTVLRPRVSIRENKTCGGLGGLVLFAKTLQLERKSFACVAKSALAGSLALLLLLSSVVAVSSAHRQSHHSDRAKPGDQCVFCLFAHGQVIAAEAQPALSRNAALLAACPLPADQTPVLTSDYRLSPSRAPPARLA